MLLQIPLSFPQGRNPFSPPPGKSPTVYQAAAAARAGTRTHGEQASNPRRRRLRQIRYLRSAGCLTPFQSFLSTAFLRVRAFEGWAANPLICRLSGRPAPSNQTACGNGRGPPAPQRPARGNRPRHQEAPPRPLQVRRLHGPRMRLMVRQAVVVGLHHALRRPRPLLRPHQGGARGGQQRTQRAAASALRPEGPDLLAVPAVCVRRCTRSLGVAAAADARRRPGAGLGARQR